MAVARWKTKFHRFIEDNLSNIIGYGLMTLFWVFSLIVAYGWACAPARGWW